MAAIKFVRLPNQSNGRRRYLATFDPSGNLLPRKQQLTSAEIMTPKNIIGPVYMPTGTDRRAPGPR